MSDSTKLLKLISRAKNDSEKFAALLLMTKTLNSDKLEADERKKIFSAISFNFVHRLLSAQKQENGEIMFNLGIQMLSTFSPLDKLVSENQTELMLEQIYEHLSNPKNHNDVTLSEIASILLTSKISSNSNISSPAFTKCLAKIVKKCENEQVALSYLQILSKSLHVDSKLWKSCQPALKEMLTGVANKINSRNDQHKFDLISGLAQLFSTFDPDCRLNYADGAWLADLKSCLFQIFSNKLSTKPREATLMLGCQLVQCFGLHKMLRSDGKKKYHVFLVKMICIEIALAVNKVANNNNADLEDQIKSMDTPLLASCFQVFEQVCQEIADFDANSSQGDATTEELFSFDDIMTLESNLTDIAQIFSDVIKSSMATKESYRDPTILASFRVIGAFLNVQYFASKPVGVNFAPTFVKFAKKMTSCSRDDVMKVVCCVTMSYCDVIKAVQCFKKEDFFSFLVHQLCDKRSEYSDETYELLCQCLMALLLQLTNSELGSVTLFMLLAQCEKQDINQPARYIHVATLTLMCINKLRTRKCEDFFCKLIRFLQKVHATDGKNVYISKRFSEQSTEMDNLWPITAKELCQSTINNLYDVTMCKEEGLAEKVDELCGVVQLGRNGGLYRDDGGVDEDIVTSYKLMKDAFATMKI